MTNPDKLNLVNYSREICNTNNFKVKSFYRKDVMINRICQTYHQSFSLYGIVNQEILDINKFSRVAGSMKFNIQE